MMSRPHSPIIPRPAHSLTPPTIPPTGAPILLQGCRSASSRAAPEPLFTAIDSVRKLNQSGDTGALDDPRRLSSLGPTFPQGSIADLDAFGVLAVLELYRVTEDIQGSLVFRLVRVHAFPFPLGLIRLILRSVGVGTGACRALVPCRRWAVSEISSRKGGACGDLTVK